MLSPTKLLLFLFPCNMFSSVMFYFCNLEYDIYSVTRFYNTNIHCMRLLSKKFVKIATTNKMKSDIRNKLDEWKVTFIRVSSPYIIL